MAQNIQIIEGVSTYPHKVIETCNRPLFIKYLGVGNPKPTMVQIDVYIKEPVSNNLIFVKKGRSLVQSRDASSTELSPTFTFDISSILKSGSQKDIKFKPYTILANSPIGIRRIDSVEHSLVHQYKVEARSWVVDSLTNVLTLNTDDDALATDDDSLYFCDIEIPDEELASTQHSNMKPPASSPIISGWRIDSSLVGAPKVGNFLKFLTNCPENTRRLLPVGAAFGLSVFGQSPGVNFQVVADFINNSNNSITADNLLTSSLVLPTANNISTVNLKADDTSLTVGLTNTSVLLMGRNIDIYLKATNITGRKIRLELIKSPLQSSNSKFRQTETHTIYFVNDYNILDFYTFESNLGITHLHSKSVFKTGYKNYSDRKSAKFGVSRGRTDIMYTLSAIVNKDTSEWLSEIYRSTDVFLLEYGADNTANYVPILVTSADTIPLPQERRNLEQFSISFRKDVRTQKR